jgi:hypothetical protein
MHKSRFRATPPTASLWKFELAKDGPQGDQVISLLESVVVGEDEDGEEITSCIVNPCEANVTSAHHLNEPKLTPNQTTAFGILHDAGATGLSQDDWNAALREAGIGVKRPATINDLRRDLKSKGLVRNYGDRWIVSHS